MKKVFAVEMKRAINIGWIISILGVCFSICFDSWNDLMRALTSHTGSIHYFFGIHHGEEFVALTFCQYLPLFLLPQVFVRSIKIIPFHLLFQGKEKKDIVQ